MVEGSWIDNFAKVIMEGLMIDCGLLRDQIAQKLICFRANGVNVFQGTNSGVTKQIRDNYALHSIGPLYGPSHQFGDANLVGIACSDLL
jgi:hypothetical protein